MKPVHIFNVLPSVPEPLKPLLRIANNIRWAWDHPAIELFRRLDQELWEASGHNPVRMLGNMDQAKLEIAATDEAFLAHLDRTMTELDSYVEDRTTWYCRNYGRVAGKADGLLVAYFSAEFGLSECLSIFAGGLGILAGDHLKAASDLSIPLVGVGLLYQQGYFSQYLNASGWQQESYTDNDFHTLPLTRMRDVTVDVELPGRRVKAQIWRCDVGRVSLYLLDANIAANRSADRDITDQLYGGDKEMRLQQEILLGIGGYRALEALGIAPSVFHMNEGHSAFLSLERVRRLMETHKMSFSEARSTARAGLVFTTHTPVAAGHDYFPGSLIDHYLGDYAQRFGLSRRDFLGLGRQNPDNDSEDFCMTVLALRLAAFSNGVSALHGEVSREMWKGLWPGVPEQEIPIGHVTNGVHFRSWISAEMNQLYDRYLGPQWREDPGDAALWKRMDSIPAEELWRTHERRRERMVAFARRRLRQQLIRRGAPPADVDAAAEALDPDALTIGFARRFATYKRATLLLRDPDRLAHILNHPERPVQIVFGGKAHPRDDAGKELIRKIVDLARQPAFRRRMVFLEDYDMAMGRYLVQGADVWLNTPLRPMEASGTSGMKAMANGALNVSTLDGWWDEAWPLGEKIGRPVGWAIGAGETYPDDGYQDQVEADALYDLLERDIVPAFYERRADDLPRRWIELMKASLKSLGPLYNMHRMVRQYTEEYYLKAHERQQTLLAGGGVRARALAAWSFRVRDNWPRVRVEAVENGVSELPLRSNVPIRARICLGDLSPDDVVVELYVGRLDATGEIRDAVAVPMRPTSERIGDAWIFATPTVLCSRSGLHGYTVRVMPSHPDLVTPFVPGLIAWPPENVAVLEQG